MIEQSITDKCRRLCELLEAENKEMREAVAKTVDAIAERKALKEAITAHQAYMANHELVPAEHDLRLWDALAAMESSVD